MKTDNVNEVRLFSQFSEDKTWNAALKAGSRSAKDAAYRKGIYQKVFGNFKEMKETFKAFSGYTEMPLLSNQYFNATMASYVRSFAGFLSIERDMMQPTALLWYMDLLGVTDNRKVLPNVGTENLGGINARFSTSATLTVGQASYTMATGKKLIPGSVEVHLIHAASPSTPVVLKDDRAGTLLGPAGVLAPNSPAAPNVNYAANGVITITIGTAFTIATGDSYTISAYEDIAGSPEFGTLTGTGNNRFKMDMKNILLTAEPDMLIAENNLMAIAATQKALGSNPQDIAAAKLTELYTKLVNGKLVNAVVNSFHGTSYGIDTAGYIDKFYDFNSRLDAFQSELINVDTALAKQSVKGVQATSYVVGEEMGNWFRKLAQTGNFVDNTGSSYINDLLGYYKGIPVLRHTALDSKTGYAIHKTADGALAPVMRGLFLPLTNTPLIGNYNNPTQFAQGIYYQEVNDGFIPELVQKFTVNE